MCTVVVLVRPYFVLLAANRDERLDRPWDPPDAFWPEYPGVVAGLDRTAGGTWLGVNRFGVAAAVLNRPGTLGPAAGKRSRGELPLLALDHSTAAQAAEAITSLDASVWRGFNMLLADHTGAFFIRGLGRGRPQIETLPPGVSMVTAHDPNDFDSPRTARHLPRFAATAPTSPDDWAAWLPILSDQRGWAAEQINVEPHGGFGTVCSSFISLPAAGKPIWRFAPGPPHEADFTPIFCPWDAAAIPPPPRCV